MRTFTIPGDNYAYNDTYSWGKSHLNQAFWFVIGWANTNTPNECFHAVQDDFGNLVEVAA